MFNETRSFAEEFPEHKAAIHQMKQSDAHFTRLLNEYDVINREIHRIEQEGITPSDAYTEKQKKERLAVKDALLMLIGKAA